MDTSKDDQIFRVIVAGSRSLHMDHYETLEYLVAESGFDIDVIVSGGARGVDDLGERYGKDNEIPVHIIPAKWSEYGKSAGFIRNEKMAKYADALIAIWDEESNGTKHMINECYDREMPVVVYKAQSETIKTANYE